MNYLAHLVLADNTPESLIGNLAGDFLRGVDPASVHPLIVPGISRHRAVDVFTDAHALAARSRARLSAHWRMFSRVLVDVFYDHFLARDFELHTGVPLGQFSRGVYAALASHPHLLPPRLASAAPIMVEHDWLQAYAHLDGVQVILGRMARRTRHGAHLADGMQDLRREYTGLEADFNEFFPQLRKQFPPIS